MNLLAAIIAIAIVAGGLYLLMWWEDPLRGRDDDNREGMWE